MGKVSKIVKIYDLQAFNDSITMYLARIVWITLFSILLFDIFDAQSVCCCARKNYITFNFFFAFWLMLFYNILIYHSCIFFSIGLVLIEKIYGTCVFLLEKYCLTFRTPYFDKYEIQRYLFFLGGGLFQ